MEAHVAPNQAVSSGYSARALRIMLVWGVRFTAESLAEMLQRDPLISIVGLCTNLSEAMTLSEALQPDIVLLDARIPDGIAALRRGLDVAPGMRVVVSAVSETERDVIAWAEAGAIGYIPRTTSLGDFVRLVQTIHSGEQECSGLVAAGLLRRITTNAARSWTRTPAVTGITKRERQTAELIKSGLSDKEIARRLNITVATTKSHVHNLLNKLNLHRRREIAEYFSDNVPSRSKSLVSLLILATAFTGQWTGPEHTLLRFDAPQLLEPARWFQSRRPSRNDGGAHVFFSAAALDLAGITQIPKPGERVEFQIARDPRGNPGQAG